MQQIYANNPDDALAQVMRLLVKESAGEAESRNGRVRRVLAPVMTIWTQNCSPVSLDATRNANPFFHVMEAMWMLAGRNDLAFVSKYAASMSQYSDDGGLTQPGAYGHRWRKHFDQDQLEEIIQQHHRNPNSRRLVLSMWDGYADLDAAGKGSADVPCNTHVYFDPVDGRLNMTVCCRSNDAVWGCYGSNVVHFTFLMEYMAARMELRRGVYYHLSNNMHAYMERPDVVALYDKFGVKKFSPDPRPVLVSEALAGSARVALNLRDELDANLDILRSVVTEVPFLDRVAAPMQRAWRLHKQGMTELALEALGTAPIDWLVAGRRWLERALERKRAKESAT